MSYTTQTKIENYALQDMDAAFQTAIDTWIEIAEDYINQATNRQFEAVTAEYEFDGNNKTRLFVGDFTALTSVEVDSTDVTSDIKTYPANTTPKNVLFYENGFDSGEQNIVVNAKWGYSDSAPKGIEFAATVFVAGLIQKHVKSTKAVKSEKIGNYQVAYSEDQFEDFKMLDKILSAYRYYPL
jgi:hypothetical protein